MQNLQEKANQKYPLFDIPKNISMTDEYNGNEIQYIKRDSYIEGFRDCQKEYELVISKILNAKKL